MYHSLLEWFQATPTKIVTYFQITLTSNVLTLEQTIKSVAQVAWDAPVLVKLTKLFHRFGTVDKCGAPVEPAKNKNPHCFYTAL